MTTILLIEDDTNLARLYSQSLSPLPCTILHAATGATGIEFAANNPDLVLLDLGLPDCSGLDVLKHLKATYPRLPVIVATAHGLVSVAVEAMRKGAYDFLVKPIAPKQLLYAVQDALNASRTPHHDTFYGFVGQSQALQQLYATICDVASSKATIFITGESGTGKEVCASAVHQHSPRAAKPFVALNCSAIPKDLLESELFGHVKGAFTGAASDHHGAALQANGGTLFLDELCEMDINLQAKLLRFIETGSVRRVGATGLEQVDVRLVCATNRDPWAEVKAGRFREDLYYRLYVIPVHLPPLRDRREDISPLASHFLESISRVEGKAFQQFSPEAMALLTTYSWPGNVRQLQNVIRQAVVRHTGHIITPLMLPALPSLVPQKLDAPHIPTIKTLRQAEEEAIEAALTACQGNITKAATLLDVNPSTLYRRLKKN